MNRYKQKTSFTSNCEYQVLQEVKALAASQHLDFTEFLHRMFLNERDRYREIRVLEN
ncbi:MAG: hypothetical protein ACRD5B_11480 [Nitrososphaeraceae archaeon]|jgi:hypothetical protein